MGPTCSWGKAGRTVLPSVMQNIPLLYSKPTRKTWSHQIPRLDFKACKKGLEERPKSFKIWFLLVNLSTGLERFRKQKKQTEGQGELQSAQDPRDTLGPVKLSRKVRLQERTFLHSHGLLLPVFLDWSSLLKDDSHQGNIF